MHGSVNDKLPGCTRLLHQTMKHGTLCFARTQGHESEMILNPKLLDTDLFFLALMFQLFSSNQPWLTPLHTLGQLTTS